jgi:hypothetical protein
MIKMMIKVALTWLAKNLRELIEELQKAESGLNFSSIAQLIERNNREYDSDAYSLLSNLT